MGLEELKDFVVEVVLTNKEKARDPTGESIQRDLLAKKGYSMISNVRSGQYLKISLEAENSKKAEEIITDMCNELRIFNPVTQDLHILNVTEHS
ncbi:MAG: Phosphoribosylformylglycinamidine synthase subunit PurS [Promethearchaeota archaeon]|jgi:phosphoribosylformylglycinamidine synthase|nr:MAG: Phosphoribosylformylglycinamidine synthase subunit PurS [Candidatus Lokiarchaeota archaeon]